MNTPEDRPLDLVDAIRIRKEISSLKMDLEVAEGLAGKGSTMASKIADAAEAAISFYKAKLKEIELNRKGNP